MSHCTSLLINRRSSRGCIFNQRLLKSSAMELMLKNGYVTLQRGADGVENIQILPNATVVMTLLHTSWVAMVESTSASTRVRPHKTDPTNNRRVSGNLTWFTFNSGVPVVSISWPSSEVSNRTCPCVRLAVRSLTELTYGHRQRT